jgi:antitoxin (DNA-binding transcriptional repressor) of toxin-antitoxin stability system
MREMSVREANQNFSQLIAAAERGETIVITKNGAPRRQTLTACPDSRARSGVAGVIQSIGKKPALQARDRLPGRCDYRR